MKNSAIKVEETNQMQKHRPSAIVHIPYTVYT